MIGENFGRWTVIDYAGSKNNRKYWLCRCTCGAEKAVRGTDLRIGKSQSCGCLKRDKASQRKLDLTNKTFGYLTALYETPKRKNECVVWHCKCKCGAECDVVSVYLTSGETRSCGCLQKERTAEAKGLDLTNQRFGNLIAQYYFKKENRQERFWHCKCDCGKEIDVITSDLTRGHTMSCGCLSRSKGELKVEQLLQENNITYQIEKIFKDLWLGEPSNKKHARFDFFVNNSYCIEFDGVQHFKWTGSGWNTEENFLRTQEYDKIKNEYCLEHNIPLIRIPYTHLSQLCLEDLLLETSQFIVKKQED